MKTHHKKILRKKLLLGDLVAIVGSCARNEQETLAALVDLFASGRVRVEKDGRFRRVQMC